MLRRFAFSFVTFIAAIVLIVASLIFGPTLTGWIAFGISIAITARGLVGLRMAEGTGERLGQAGIALIGVWSIVASLVFAGAVLSWTVFGDAVAIAALSLVQLISNELATQRSMGLTRSKAQSTDKMGIAA